MDKVTNWREKLRQHLEAHGTDEQRRWVAFAREQGEPLGWEEVCSAWHTNHKATQQDIEQFMGEIEAIIETGA